MTIHYIPNKQISIGEVVIKFGESRESIRTKMGEIFKADDQIIPLGPTDTDVLYQRRDVYENIYSEVNYFFLNYDNKDFLSELEIHNCTRIKVLASEFNFNEDLVSISSKLEKYSEIEERGRGELFFKDLKVILMDKRTMGGEGSTLGYFYCTPDITHLAT